MNKLAARVGSLRRQEVWKEKEEKKKKKKKTTRHTEIFPFCSFLSLSLRQGLRQETLGYRRSLRKVHTWCVSMCVHAHSHVHTAPPRLHAGIIHS